MIPWFHLLFSESHQHGSPYLPAVISSHDNFNHNIVTAFNHLRRFLQVALEYTRWQKWIKSKRTNNRIVWFRNLICILCFFSCFCWPLHTVKFCLGCRVIPSGHISYKYSVQESLTECFKPLFSCVNNRVFYCLFHSSFEYKCNRNMSKCLNSPRWRRSNGLTRPEGNEYPTKTLYIHELTRRAMS